MYILRTYTCKTTGNTYDVNIRIMNEEPVFNTLDIFKVINDMEVSQKTIDYTLMTMNDTEIYKITCGYAVYGGFNDNPVFYLTYKGLQKLFSKIIDPKINNFEEWINEIKISLYS